MVSNSYQMSNLFLRLNQLLWRVSFLQNIRLIYYWIDKILLASIPKPQKDIHEKKKVLVVYNLALGDCVMISGVVSDLRQAFPADEYDLAIACQPAFGGIFENDFDEVIPLNYSEATTSIKARKKVFKRLAEQYYDIVLDPVGCDLATMNVYAVNATTADMKIGLIDEGVERKQLPEKYRAKIYDRVIKVPKKNRHLIEKYSYMFQEIGCVGCQARPATLKPIDLPDTISLPKNYFIVFPAASISIKRWPVERFAEIVKRIYQETHFCLVVCGTDHDREVIRAMIALSDGVPVVDIIEKTTIPQLAEVIRRARFVVTNDTSVYHIAIAGSTTVFLACGGYTFDKYANYKYADKGYKDPILVHNHMDCFNCDNYCRYIGCELFPCIDNITVDDMWKAIKGEIENVNSD